MTIKIRNNTLYYMYAMVILGSFKKRLKGHYCHDQNRLSTGHGIGVTVTGNNYWVIYAAATVI